MAKQIIQPKGAREAIGPRFHNHIAHDRNRKIDMFKRKLVLAAGLAVLASSVATTFAQAQTYPDRPIKLIIPLAPGGGTDVTGRTLADSIAEDWKATIVPENKTGGGTTIASATVASAPADGYTVYVNTASFIISARMMPNLSYDPQKDFVPVSLAASSDHVLVVSSKLPVKTFADFVAWVKSRNGDATFASFGAGSSSHLGFELFLNRLGLNMTHIPYKGNAPAMTDLLGGHVDAMFADHVDESLKSDKLRILAVAGAKRSPELPDVPTLQELGLKDFTSRSFYGVMVRSGTPQPIIDKWNVAIRAALQKPEIKAKLGLLGIDPIGSTQAEYASYLKAEDDKYKEALALPSVKSTLK
jgi:tripartite-type tricarboxylate transporter receptor subunit TctC